MFTDKDLQDAIEAGIFDEMNNVPANPTQVIRWFEKWATLKCKETARNVRHKACEISGYVCTEIDNSPYYSLPSHLSLAIDQQIMNIQFEDIKPVVEEAT